jgi:hypothetical protein
MASLGSASTHRMRGGIGRGSKLLPSVRVLHLAPSTLQVKARCKASQQAPAFECTCGLPGLPAQPRLHPSSQVGHVRWHLGATKGSARYLAAFFNRSSLHLQSQLILTICPRSKTSFSLGVRGTAQTRDTTGFLMLSAWKSLLNHPQSCCAGRRAAAALCFPGSAQSLSCSCTSLVLPAVCSQLQPAAASGASCTRQGLPAHLPPALHIQASSRPCSGLLQPWDPPLL